MRMLLPALLLLLLVPSLPAEDAAPSATLPPDAQRVIDDRDAAISRAKKVYDTAVARATADAVKKLDPVLTKLTKAGDLKEAVTVSNLRDSLVAEGGGDAGGDGSGHTAAQPAISLKDFTITNLNGKQGSYTIGPSVPSLLTAGIEGGRFRIHGAYDDAIGKSCHLGKVILSPVLDVAAIAKMQFLITENQAQGGGDHVWYNVVGQNQDTKSYFGLGFGSPSGGSAIITFKVDRDDVLTVLSGGAKIGELSLGKKAIIGIGITTRFQGDMVDATVMPGPAP